MRLSAGGQEACLRVWLRTCVHAGTRFPLGSSPGLASKLYSPIHSEWWQPLAKQLPAPASLLASASPAALPQLCCAEMCSTKRQHQNSVGGSLRDGLLTCRTERRTCWGTGENRRCPFHTDPWQPGFHYPVSFTVLAELIDTACITLFFWQKSFREILFLRWCPRRSARVWGENTSPECWRSAWPWTRSVQLHCYCTVSSWWWTRWMFSWFCSQIRSPKLEEYHGFWPGDAFTLSPKLTGTIAACFSQAFKFEYTEGKVGSIYAPENCPILCTNLVRGILNMMQITIKKSQNVYELQEVCFFPILILHLCSFTVT